MSAPAAGAQPRAHATSSRVLLVGTYKGHRGKFKSIEAAVKAAHRGDFVLVAPGDYKEAATQTIPGAKGDDRAGAAILVTKPGLTIRGMQRNRVMIDGTKPGSPRCSPAAGDQTFGAKDSAGKTIGRNGIVVYKANNVSIENLSACNFLTGSRGGGDEIWWDGGGATGKQPLGAWYGYYLSATSTFYRDSSSPAANYGIYASNTHGPGLLNNTYANNQGDAAYYIGACPDCNTVLNHAHGENSDLGYSGTNSGGRLIIRNSEFDANKSGFVTNSQNNDDVPSPQTGACPTGVRSKAPAGAQLRHSCWVFEHNNVHDNNNPNVPNRGTAAITPVGTGLLIAGGRDNIVINNRFTRNGAWGVLLAPFPDTGTPPPLAHCQGGDPNTGLGCYFDDFGNEIAHNTFSQNGFFGNPSNGDLAEISRQETPGNCWHDNVRADKSAITSDPANIQATHGTCGQPNSGNQLGDTLTAQAICNTELLSPCPTTPGMTYPRVTQIALMPLPRQATMPHPCAGVPANAFCAGTSSPRHTRPRAPRSGRRVAFTG